MYYTNVSYRELKTVGFGIKRNKGNVAGMQFVVYSVKLRFSDVNFETFITAFSEEQRNKLRYFNSQDASVATDGFYTTVYYKTCDANDPILACAYHGLQLLRLAKDKAKREKLREKRAKMLDKLSEMSSQIYSRERELRMQYGEPIPVRVAPVITNADDDDLPF